MSHSVKQPVGQKRHTNIALVKYKSYGKRFEIACFRNKVRDWREGKEKDIDEVLQTATVFSNVSKGTEAKAADLQVAFGTTNQEQICKIILEKGDYQVQDKEREKNHEEQYREIATLCTERLVHAVTKRQLTVQMVMDALKAQHFSLKDSDSAKKQSLKALDLLVTKMPDSFVRANMRLNIVGPSSAKERITTRLQEICIPYVEINTELDEATQSYSVTFESAPSCYRELDALVVELGKQAKVQILECCVAEKDQQDIDEAFLQMENHGNSAEDGVPDRQVMHPSSGADPGPAPASVVPTTRTVVPTPAVEPQGEANKADAPAGPSCSTCSATNLQETFRLHCKSEWHSFNVKRKFKKMDPVNEDEFQELKFDQEFMANFRGVD